MVRYRRNRRAMSDINMVPFIDIMMVLLVAFMVTTPMLMQGVDVQLPNVKGTTVEIPPAEQPLIIAIKKGNRYYLNLQATGDEVLKLDDMVNTVARIVAAKPSTPVLLKGDRNVRYESVVVVMAKLQKAGVNDVGLITEPEAL